MLFSSVIFLFLFLPLVLLFYFLYRGTGWRNLFLVFASLFFYAWGEKFFCLVMILSILVNYTLGLAVDTYRETKYVKIYMTVAVIFNLGLLAFFKYANFLINNLNIFFKQVNISPIEISKIHLAAGISFFTFHALSYVIDIYRQTAKPQKSLINLALYFSFFPQLIAGPIVRYHDLETQLSKRKISLNDFAQGVRRFCLGLGKKMLIANTLAEPADKIFLIPPEHLTTDLAWLGIICYTLQIYFDFSGYSDMAIGLARMFGFHFLENFNYPYISKSIREFWRRWHISLSNWFRDYLYIPLGGNRCSPIRNSWNLIIVFVLCGLWHGANWNFIIWGLFYGIFLVLERTKIMNWMNYVWIPIRHLYVILVVIIAWVFFRTDTISYALAFLKAMVGIAPGAGTEYNLGMYINIEISLTIVLGIIGSMPILPWILSLREKLLTNSLTQKFSTPVEIIFSLASGSFITFIFIASSMKMASGTYNPFIYFRF